MDRISKAVAVFMLVLLGTAVALGQEKEGQVVRTPPPREFPVYKLDFVIAELEDGKRVNSRAYSMVVQEKNGGHINVATRVPVNVGSVTAPGMQIQYMDVGLTLDYRISEEDSFVVIAGGTRIDSFATGPQPESNAPNMPVTRRVSVDGQAAVTPGKPTIIGSVDDVNSKKRYEVQVTATKIK